ncbi:MAG: acetyltransferase [Synergistaceae bacterium]|jgi:sugar O-acyltransferase (sialic acid O-acetyltransferase NeuD family)|nr:acetyltransferase [Synergistaceae bacterium]
MKNLFIVGDTSFSELIALYMEYSGQYRVVGFSVEEKYLSKNFINNVPVVPLEQVEKYFSVEDTEFFVAVGYKQLNKIRTRLYEEVKNKGYKAASYIDKHAIIGPDVSLGEHIFLFENVVIQPHAVLSANTIVWASSTITHDSHIFENCFLGAGSTVGGFAKVRKNCFVGMNATIHDHVEVGEYCIVGAGARVHKSIPPKTLVMPAEERILFDAADGREYF